MILFAGNKSETNLRLLHELVNHFSRILGNRQLEIENGEQGIANGELKVEN